jgi:DNA modification methylase
VDLIYLDPPFFSNKNYEVIWGDEAEVRSFKDRWKGGIHLYTDWMRKRVAEMYRILKPTGSIYLHCDWHASHYLKVMMDTVFGYSNFRNEVVWSYKRYTAASQRFQRLHDTILFYSKTNNATFNVIREEYGSRSGKADSHYKLDEEGRWFRWQKRKGQEPYKVYLSEGRRLGDVWELPLINASAKERLGYPTQKPEKLLQRIIEASSNPGDVVLDPFCGCGTTIAVAQMMRRYWIGIDISLTAAEIMKARVEKVGAKNVEIINEPKNEVELRWLKPFEFQNWVMRKVDGRQSPKKSGDMGIDGYTPIDQLPIQVKRSSRVGRPVVDTFETAVERAKAEKGYIVAFSFTKGAEEEAARARTEKGLDIELVTAKELLLGTHELVAPVLNRQVLELPIEDKPVPKPPPKKALPGFEELMDSEENSEEVA